MADCGCFGSVVRQRVGAPLIIRNLVIAAILVADAVAGPQQLIWVQNQVQVLVILGVLAVCGVLWRLSQRAQARKETAGEA
ncbi:MAG: hypothetical protein QM720_11945 [Microbacterium sp.]